MGLKDSWWSRARWALDLTLSEREADRDVGFAVLIALADSEYADQHETEVVDAALGAAIGSYLASDPGSGQTHEADLRQRPGDEP